MSIFNILSLFGGLAMFLYGMRLMSDSLRENSSGTLKVAIEHVTNNPVKAFLLGLGITVIIQSSTATIVITSGLVGAGLLSLHQALGIIVGANVGTTITGQIIRLLDLDSSSGAILQMFRPSTLAPVALIIGIILIMSAKTRSRKTVGNILLGFGILFSGLINMTGAVDTLSQSELIESLLMGLGDRPLVGYVVGAGVAFVLQSSSAAVGILQAFSTSGLLVWKSIYPVIIGIYLGDCVTTAIVCSIGAKADSKRVGTVNILFNLGKMALSFLIVFILHKTGLIEGLWDRVVDSGIIANTNTVFNLACAVILFPLLGTFERLSRKINKDDPVPENKYQDKLESLSPAFFTTPALALNGCYDVLVTMFDAARENIDRAIKLIDVYSEKADEEIRNEEDNIDTMTDRVSHYIVELLPRLSVEMHVSILDQYYKVASEFERLGDCAVNIADVAADLAEKNKQFSLTAQKELEVLSDITYRILDKAEMAFKKRDVDSAYAIEPLEQVAESIVSTLKVKHLKRISSGKCDILIDTDFINLVSELKRISDICSNVGAATVIRVNPELADQEHDYYSELHSRRDVDFQKAYNKAYAEYFTRLDNVGSVSGENK